MKISEIMTKEVISLSVDDTVERAAQIMKEYNIGSIPVNTKGRGLVGIITDRDIILRCVAEGKDIKVQKIREIMTSNPVVGDENINVNDATRIMGERQIRRLPITSNNELIGIVTLGDLALETTLKQETTDVLCEISIPCSHCF
ncbi:CBS domain-containing protein [Clostridium estertheticum]|uniref:CBS domain-containing protein n=1 Tax=Clostridium estertheticum TaxID=238834 RepID=UPI001CF17E7D|nr:CBS domain-containing protein [Clostridium estertheticum]MCB2305169.1 CBS domain-containing protein [Clostridium estertheticum]MCB2343561.1 CBS domain-containing protein [Clostridium estertheticum]MCB2348481.1 CBS domain-containing protein [Clostridium estertheticum]WAG47429.1 CBS domain-containing protein [Clostridium estertheticum]